MKYNSVRYSYFVRYGFTKQNILKSRHCCVRGPTILHTVYYVKRTKSVPAVGEVRRNYVKSQPPYILQKASKRRM